MSSGAKMDFQENLKQSPLFLAVSKNSCELTELLTSKGADVNVKRQDGTSLLFIALQNR
ncbi:ankyrin repeat domain-containing protein, partial [Elusimicrobiota bacterium]